MTELGFLVDLLVNHKLAKLTKDAVVSRIKEVECRTSSSSQSVAYLSQRSSLPAPSSLPSHIASQSPSTQIAMMRQMGDGVDLPPPETPPQPVAVVAQTPAAVAAVNAREQSIRQAMSGKPMPGETKPRKF